MGIISLRPVPPESAGIVTHWKMSSVLEQIESKYPVEQILVNGEQVWPYLRCRYQVHHSADRLSVYGEAKDHSPATMGGKPIDILLQFTKEIVRGLPYGFRNWFRKYDYIALTDIACRREVGGKYVNRFLDPIIDELGPARVLCIEGTAASRPYVMSQVYTRYAISRSLVLLLTLMIVALRRVFFRRYKITNKDVLDRVEQDSGLNTNYAEVIEFFEAGRKVYTHLFRRMRPKAILLTCYYDAKMPAIRSARSLGIKVVEVQHGTIGRGHPAYNVHRDMDRSCFPEHLLVFGERELATFDNPRFIDRANVHPVGSYYIDYIRTNYRPDPQLSEQISGYERIVGVTLQWTCERRLVDFLCEAAELDAGILYILIPREPERKEYSDMVMPPNIVVVRDKNFYELMAYCDFHTTVYSTCALEAPSLGVQNILVDIDGRARANYTEVLTDGRLTRFADTPEEYVDTIRDFARVDRDDICDLHKGFFATNYREHIRSFVKTYLL